MVDLSARIAAQSDVPIRYGSARADAFIQPYFKANAMVKSIRSATFAADALVGQGGSITQDAILKKTRTATFTANAALI